MNKLIVSDKGLSKNSLAQVPAEEIWLANFISKQTRNTYRLAVKEFLSFHKITSLEELRQINQAHVISFREALTKNGASPSTVQNRLSALSSLFKHLCEQQVLRFNPTTGVKRPRSNQGQVKAPLLTRSQVRQLLDAPDQEQLIGLRDNAILHILFYTGCRRAEIGNLKVKDFYEDGGYFVLNFLVKGGKRNLVAVHQEVIIAIKRYLEESGHQGQENSPLFLGFQNSKIGKPLCVRQLNNIFNKYVLQTKLPKHISPHSARATFTTEALEKGVPIEAVQKTVGHSNISTTKMYDKRTLKHRESASFAIQF